MKIAIVAPSHVPFTIGGAESLWWGLLRSINENTPHMAELIKLPAPEHDFWSIIESYRAFSNLDLSHFDCIISTKYPAWMVSHRRHICYLQHKLRGLYDTYHLTNRPRKYQPKSIRITDVQNFMQASWGRREALAEFFDRLDALRQDKTVPSAAFDFPGPFIRELVHFMDGIGLSKKAIHKYATISKNVRQRKDYFPTEAEVDIIYHPSFLPFFKCRDYQYFFTASRLVAPKRIDLMIKAMRHVSAPVQLIVAGTGPDEERLKHLASGDKRIQFIGYVSDEELIHYYADALAVLYMPYDEDYGLITIEAMMSEKPVITAVDAGGPLEFVQHAQTGFSVPSDPKNLAEKMRVLYDDPELAKQMGEAAKKQVEGITWSSTVSRLLGEKPGEATTQPYRKPKLTVASTFPVYPPMGGGQQRIFHLYRHLAPDFDINLVTLTGSASSCEKCTIAEGIKEIRIPKSHDHGHLEYHQFEKKLGHSVTDICFPLLCHHTPAYSYELKNSVKNSDYVIASHPYTFYTIQELFKGRIIYEAHNVEFDLKKDTLPENKTGREMLTHIRQIEGACARESHFVIACSQEVKDRLVELYHIEEAKIFVIPNGVNADSVEFTAFEKRSELKHRLGLSDYKIAIFIGSMHPPNTVAINFIVDLASQLPHILFFIVGSCCQGMNNRLIPDNVFPLGVVDDTSKEVILGFADMALNPMTTGCGTNMKVLEYMAAGIPVISTAFGIRGLQLTVGQHVILSELQDFAEAIKHVLAEPLTEKESRIRAARKHIEMNFDWKMIADEYRKVLLELETVSACR